MKQVFCFVGSPVSETQWSIDGTELFHLEKVLRLKTGDAVELIDGHGKVATGRLGSIEKTKAAVDVEQTVSQPSTKRPIVIAVSAMKHGSMDEVLPSLVELGVDEIAVFRPKSGEKDRINDKATERWQRVVVAACKQSKRGRFPKISVFESLGEFLERGPSYEKAYFFDELGHSSQQIQLSAVDQATILIVGNEAGLGSDDRQLLQSKGIKGLRFGDYIMRSTTALVAAATLLQSARTLQNP